MTASPTIRTVGGNRLNSLLQQIQTRQGKLISIEVGFFETARYPEGTSVPMVAAIHEFGAPNRNIPARPFFQNAIPHIEQQVKTMVLQDLRSQAQALGMTGPISPPTLDDSLLNKIGAKAAGIIQQSIVDIRTPPLSQKTILARQRRRGRGRRRARGSGKKIKVSKVTGLSANPLIDTGFLRRSVTWNVKR